MRKESRPTLITCPLEERLLRASGQGLSGERSLALGRPDTFLLLRGKAITSEQWQAEGRARPWKREKGTGEENTEPGRGERAP